MTNNEQNNFEVMQINGGVPIKHWTKGVEFEDGAKEQLKKLSVMPFIFKHIAVMPDVHQGIGSTVGSVVATKGAIIPASVSVDIGCGIHAIKTSLKAKDLPTNLFPMRELIERKVPCGRTNNGGAGDRGAWTNPPQSVLSAWHKMRDHYEKIIDKHPKIVRSGKTDPRAVTQLCSLGTGNHFIEVCLDLEQSVWVMLHSGSRGIGNSFGSYFINIAKEEMIKNHIHLIDKDLSYLSEGSESFNDYCDAVEWAQNYAKINRELMMERVLDAIRETSGVPPFQAKLEAVHCHHNYISEETHFGESVLVTRKGAVRADLGMMGIIPGSMGTKSYITRGKGNPESFCSSSHGSGRRMSRTEAKRTFSVEDHIKATEGVECLKNESVLDETPGSYKKIENTMLAQSDLVNIVYELKQILNVKG